MLVLACIQAFAGAEGDPLHETPSSHRTIKLGIGSVDAVSGSLNLRVPLGPRLPGRIPIGFTWSFDNQDGLQSAYGPSGGAGSALGGDVRPVVWPAMMNFGDSPLQCTVLVDGHPMVFHRRYEAGRMPRLADLQSRMLERGVNPAPPRTPPPGYLLSDPGSLQVTGALPSSDGTKFLVAFSYLATVEHYDKNTQETVLSTRALAPGYAIIDGPNAIWTQRGNGVLPFGHALTHFSNRWGDHITVEESETTVEPDFQVLTTIVIQDQVAPGNTLTLSVTPSGLPATYRKSGTDARSGLPYDYPASLRSTGQMEVTNSLGLPKATLLGACASKQRFVPKPASACPGYDPQAAPEPEYTWDYGFVPLTITHTAEDQSVQKLGFDWGEGLWLTGNLKQIDYPNGLRESFQYDSAVRLSALSFSECDGAWMGFRHVRGAYAQEEELGAFVSRSVARISRQDTVGTTPGECYQILRVRPWWDGTPLGQTRTLWTCKEYESSTAILHYPVAQPDSGSPYRAVRLTHPSYRDDLDLSGPQGYLFATTAVLYEENLTGTGLSALRPSDLGSDPFQVVVYDGFDLRSWANPSGSLANGLPVNAVPLRTTVHTKDLPTRTTVAGNPNTPGARDDYGPVITDEYTDIPSQTLPTPDGAAVPVWSNALPSMESSRPTWRRGEIQRSFDGSRMALQIKSDRKSLTLDSAQTHTARFASANSALPAAPPANRVGQADFGTTTYDYDDLGRVIRQQGDRAGFSAVEARSYVPGFPLILDLRKEPLLGPDGPYLPNPDRPEVVAGKAYTWLDTHVQAGPSTVMDKVDGRVESFSYETQLGREISHTDVLGITTRTDYDAWGRKWRMMRQQKGVVGSVIAESTYDVNGRWKEESVTADGKTLRTRTEWDAFGRTMKVITFDAAGSRVGEQAFEYDGFGQKTAQSPNLKPTQQPWGMERWAYDDRGRMTDHWDAQGRLLQHTVQHPSWTSISDLAAVWTSTQDDRGHVRSEGVDLLGQKRALVDQAGQLSEYFYDQDGHLLQTLQGGGAARQQRSYAYNPMGWLISRTEPEEGTTVYSKFTMSGTPLVSEQYGREGSTVRNTFTTTLDGHNQPSSVVAAGPEGSVVRRFGYDPASRLPVLLSETQDLPDIWGAPQTVTEAYGYDDLFRLNWKSVSDGQQSFIVSQTLNALGQVTSLTYPEGGGRPASTVAVDYDNQNRPRSVRADGNLRGMMIYDQISGTTVTNTLILGNGATTLSTSDKDELVLTQHAVSGGVVETNAITWSAGGLMLSRGNDAFSYDELQRLSASRVVGIHGERVEQWFGYDAFGNRVQSNFAYAEGEPGSLQPPELRAWRADSMVGNDLPGTLVALSQGSPAMATTMGTYDTGRQYDALGRLSQVFAYPGTANALASWLYDPSGRVVKENGTSYLLEASGLRFKRMRADGSLDYTVYGFGREPLAQFSVPSPVGPPKYLSATASGRARHPAAGATILQPSATITVAPGSSVAFVGETTFGTACSWDFGDHSRAVGARTSHVFTQASSYTVTFRARAAGYRPSADSVVVRVLARPSITRFTANPASILPGESALLSWKSSGATQLSIDQGVGAVAGKGHLKVSPKVTTTYTLTATNAAGSVTAQVTVAVNAPASPSIAEFSATASTIALGQSSTLTWSVANATSLILDGIGPVVGNSLVVSPTATTTYVLRATNGVGSVSASITVVVEVGLPVIEEFYADPQEVLPGGLTTLRWSVSQADGLEINGMLVTGNSLEQSPTVTTTYTLTARNLVGVVTATVTVMARAPGALVWKRSIVYGFGQELSEDSPGVGTMFIQSDQVGSPSVMTDASGTIVGRSKNLPFGERMVGWGKTALRRFTNHEEDPDSEAIYMQAREYLPAYGKFAQVDPVYDQTKDDPESWNLYNYVTNNPVTKTDPDGRIAELPEMDASSSRISQSAWGFGDSGGIGLWHAETDNMKVEADNARLLRGGTQPIAGTSEGATTSVAKAKETEAPVAHTAQTNTSGDLPPVPGAVSLPNGGKDLPAPGQGTTDLSLASTDGGGEAKSKRADMLEKMRAADGTPYGHGKQEPGAKGQLDCSGLVKWALSLEGIQLKLGPGTSGATQIIGAAGVSQVSIPQPGDLAYWSKPFAHIMIVTSPGMVYGASRPGIAAQERPEKYFGIPTYYRVGALDAPK
jgi:RHS repeat-associated protein